VPGSGAGPQPRVPASRVSPSSPPGRHSSPSRDVAASLRRSLGMHPGCCWAPSEWLFNNSIFFPQLL